MTWLKRIAIGVGVGAVVVGVWLYVSFGAFLPWREEEEAARLAELTHVAPGQTVAEIGAGSGRFTVALARKVGPGGRVLSTELNAERRRDIRDRVAQASLANVTIVEATPDSTGLPDDCCDLIFMRSVYHHVRGPEAFVASLARAVRATGLVAIIDFEPHGLWLHDSAPDVGSRRPGHGVARVDVATEMRAAGFRVRHDIPAWSGPLWLVLFERVTPAVATRAVRGAAAPVSLPAR